MNCKACSLLVVAVAALGCIPPPTASKKASSETSQTATPAEAPPMERVVAEAGVGKAGRSLDEHEGIIVTPVKALFSTKERLTFEVQLKQAMDLYEAQFGKPKSHEEFMSQVVEANGIRLPALPEGHKYVYDPQQGELMVERPAR